MNVFSLVLALILGGLVTWLVIDTIIYCVRKHKERKKSKEVETDSK